MAVPNLRAHDRFSEIVDEIRILIDAIRDTNEAHYELPPEQITWARVGDTEGILDGLKEVDRLAEELVETGKGK